MYLITSAAYISQELQSEFGLIPPAFLPLGNRPLVYEQVSRIAGGERIVLTLPNNFSPKKAVLDELERRGVEILYIPEELTLGESICFALNVLLLSESETVRIIHGDTLIKEIPGALDCLGVGEVVDAYDWAIYQAGSPNILGQNINSEDDKHLVANGFFSFSQHRELIRSFSEEKYNFLGALNNYNKRIGLNVVLMSDNWFDFGHINTYFRSKNLVTTQRAFNLMDVSEKTVVKKSTKRNKLKGEAFWYESLPHELRTFTPKLISTFDEESYFGYEIEYLFLPTLNEIFVFGRLPFFVWKKVLNACLDFVDRCNELPRNPDEKFPIAEFLGNKTKSRLEEFSQASGFDLNKELFFDGVSIGSISSILEYTDSLLSEVPSSMTFYHGDYCFSNIFFDFRTNAIKTIDPRAIDSYGEISLYGTYLYDLAKLSHSVHGLYDFIIAEQYECHIQGSEFNIAFDEGSTLKAIQEYFFDLLERKYNLPRRVVVAMEVHLFLSMLPLHSDCQKRQYSLLANALRLYKEMKEL